MFCRQQRNSIFLAPGPLDSYFGSILTTLGSALDGKYQRNNKMFLYRIIGILAKHVIGSRLNNPEYIPLILPALMANWYSLENGQIDEDMTASLLNCMSRMIKAFGSSFLPHSQEVFLRCILLTSHLQPIVRSLHG